MGSSPDRGHGRATARRPRGTAWSARSPCSTGATISPGAAWSVLGGRCGRAASGRLYLVAELAALAHLPVDRTVAGLSRSGRTPVSPAARGPLEGKVLDGAEAAEPAPGRAVGRRRPPAPSRSRGHRVGEVHAAHQPGPPRREEASGAVVIDPKGDLVTDILDRLPAGRPAGWWCSIPTMTAAAGPERP